MRQRAVIALSVVLKPKLLFLDEPTTALDVVVQRSITELLNELRQEFGFGVVFITHDLSLLVEIADRIAIMYAGAIIEEAPAKELYEHPDHPYTIGLMNAFPPVGAAHKRMEGLTGQPPDLSQLPAGCSYSPRCPKFIPGVCDVIDPPEITPVPGHRVVCHLFSQKEASVG
jgi:oligopeptide/dipeptide ABC transporter ATP-binding protein